MYYDLPEPIKPFNPVNPQGLRSLEVDGRSGGRPTARTRRAGGRSEKSQTAPTPKKGAGEEGLGFQGSGFRVGRFQVSGLGSA